MDLVERQEPRVVYDAGEPAPRDVLDALHVEVRRATATEREAKSALGAAQPALDDMTDEDARAQRYGALRLAYDEAVNEMDSALRAYSRAARREAGR